MNEYEHERWMRLAMVEASKGWNRTQPNPSVGAVIVRNNTLLSQGYTLPAGGDHAEIAAINKCSPESLSGSTIYATLEPCSHHGKTPPCVNAIIDAGISTVVIGVRDPNPLVNGRGVMMLRAAGIEVIEDILSEELTALYSAFFLFISQKRIKVTVKIAQTKNGCIAGPEKEQITITSKMSRKKVHDLRTQADAIMVGGITAEIDNPQLDTRLSEVPYKTDPDRVILDYPGAASTQLKLFRSDGRKVFVASSKEGDYPAHVTHLTVSSDSIYENLKSLFKQLYKRGVHHLLIEPGGILASELIKYSLFDELYLFTSNKEITNGYKWNKYEGFDWKEPLDFCTFEHIETDLLEVFRNPNAFSSKI